MKKNAAAWMLALLVFSSCASRNILFSKEKMLYGEALRQSFQRDWDLQKKQTSGELWRDSVDTERTGMGESSCAAERGGKFTGYEVDRLPLGATLYQNTSALFCPPEKRYWVTECSGDVSFSCRWSGPFAFDPAKDGTYRKAVEVLDLHDRKTLKKLDAAKIADLEFLNSLSSVQGKKA